MFHKVHFHKGYVEWDEAREEGIDIRQLFGKYHHILWSEKGEISLVKLNDFMGKEDVWYWEIMCLKGNLFEDVERFNTKKEAMKKIEELLT